MMNHWSLVLMTNAPSGLEGVPSLTVASSVFEIVTHIHVHATVLVRLVKIKDKSLEDGGLQIVSWHSTLATKSTLLKKSKHTTLKFTFTLLILIDLRHCNEVLIKTCSCQNLSDCSTLTSVHRGCFVYIRHEMQTQGQFDLSSQFWLVTNWPSRLQMLEWKPQAFPDTFQLSQPNISHDSHCFSIALASCCYASGHISLVSLIRRWELYAIKKEQRKNCSKMWSVCELLVYYMITIHRMVNTSW